MARNLIRRLGYALLMALGVSLIVFFLAALLPGDYVRTALAGGRYSPEFAQKLREIYGLDIPVFQRYLNWLFGALRGDLGRSLSTGKPVTELIGAALPTTVTVGAAAFALELLLGIGLGAAGAWRKGGGVDRFGVAFSLITLSLPSFILALGLQKWLALDLRLLPLGGLSTPGMAPGFWDSARHLFLPCLTLALLEAGRLSRYVRASMAETLRAGYLKAARAGGLPLRKLMGQYALRNALIPVITYLGLSLPALLGGALVIETVFALPGMGQLGYRAILARDYPLVLGIALLLCLATVAGNTLADIGYRLADPRIRTGGKIAWAK